MQYTLAIAGGTFDHFHAGHEAFLRTILFRSDQLLLGITSDRYVQSQQTKTGLVQSYAMRKKQVEAFLAQEKALARVTIEPIDDLFYPDTWSNLPIEAIMVTNDSKKGAETINAARAIHKLPPLKMVIVPVITDKVGQKISSSAIRSGHINTKGEPYMSESLTTKDLSLPGAQRHWFQEPFGELLTTVSALQKENPEHLVSVGDVVTQTCNQLGLGQKLSVIDYVVQRKKTHHRVEDLGFTGNETILHAHNPAGKLHHSLFTAVLEAIDLLAQPMQIVLVIDGEEDLAVIPLVLALPLGYMVVYGQPKKGVIRLEITPEAKDKARRLLEKFIEI
jgi:cytidyltransferase-like protein